MSWQRTLGTGLARTLTAGRLTVAEVIDLQAIQDGQPQILVGGPALSREVRWLHVAESPTTARFLQGGELVLATGAGWPEDLAAHTGALIDAGAVGVVLELGTRFATVPDEVIGVCRDRRTPLVALHRQVRFVAVTEAAHRRLVSSQVAALQARDEVQAVFAELNRAGASADHIVAEVAAMLDGPVVLEDLLHRVVCSDAHGHREVDVLAQWSTRSRAEGSDDDRVRHTAEVAARGRRWGRLVALRVDAAASPSAVGLVLTQGALALSLGAMAALTERDTSWEAVRQRRLLRVLTERRFTSPAHLVRLLETAGLPISQGPVAGVAWTIRSAVAQHTPDWLDRAREAATRVAGPLRITIACGALPSVPAGVLALLTLPAGHPDPASLVRDFVDRLRQDSLHVDVAAAGGVVGPTGRDTDALLASLGQAHDLLEAASPGTSGLLRVRGTEIDLLMASVPPERAQRFAEDLLGPLLQHDARHGSDLLAVLEAYLRHPSNRTQAALESHLSRSVFYERLQLLETLLRCDLRDGSALAALHLAVSAYRRTSDWAVAPRAAPD